MNKKTLFTYLPNTALIVMLCAAIFFVPQKSTAQTATNNTATVKGQIIDEHKQPIAFATLQAGNTGAQSDFDGFFTMQLPKGKHTIIINIVGFQKIEKQIEIKNLQKVYDLGAIQLTSKVEQLEEVQVVTSYKKALTGKTGTKQQDAPQSVTTTQIRGEAPPAADPPSEAAPPPPPQVAPPMEYYRSVNTTTTSTKNIGTVTQNAAGAYQSVAPRSTPAPAYYTAPKGADNMPYTPEKKYKTQYDEGDANKPSPQIANTKDDETEDKNIPEVFSVYEKIAAFKDLKQYIEKNLEYPAKALETNVSGIAYVQFIVNTDGSVSEAKVVRGLSQECNEAALKLVQNMPPNWTPAEQNGKKVKQKFTLPIKFNGDGTVKPIEPPTAKEQPQNDFNTENYNPIVENEYLESVKNPLSTFSIDVDNASYSNLRRFINANERAPEGAIRLEEMINYFDYSYNTPAADAKHPFAITTEMQDCPWNNNHRLLLIGLQGKELDLKKAPNSNLVFLIDVSGSMSDANKLPLVIESLTLLTKQMRPDDKVSIVVYAGSSGLVLPPTSGKEKDKIINALQDLRAGGSTAGGQGIQLAYKTAIDNFIKNGNNRVILCTDGDFNVGASSESELVELIQEKRKSGVYLSVLGFGRGNYQDAKMEQLADKGNGNYAYIDNINEAKKVFIEQFAGTLYAIAKDVKLQLEFNPNNIKAYRLIGYENRMLAAEDFNDDKKDAGELGAGHRVTALYELILNNDKTTALRSVDSLKYQKITPTAAANSGELLTVKFRYKPPQDTVSLLITKSLGRGDLLTSPTENFLWASSVAEFGLVLRNSKFRYKANFDAVIDRAKKAKGKDAKGYRQEFIELVEKAKTLYK